MSDYVEVPCSKKKRAESRDGGFVASEYWCLSSSQWCEIHDFRRLSAVIVRVVSVDLDVRASGVRGTNV